MDESIIPGLKSRIRQLQEGQRRAMEARIPANTLRNADGTPYQAGKSRHNGNLDERGDVTVDYSPKSKSGTYVRIFMIDDGAVLTPKQALSLLAWLEQERETLERLANS